MNKALLINPGFHFGKIKKKHTIFPFGLGYIASFAEKNGFQIDVLDIISEEIDFDEVRKKISKIDFQQYNLIGITGIVNQYLYVKELAQYLKKYTEIPIILGGPLSTYSWNIILNKTKIDICVIGEGELTFLDLLNKKKLETIDGIIYKNKNKIYKNKKRELIKNIDDIGIPAYHLFDMNYYTTNAGMLDVIRSKTDTIKVIPMLTSRGCPYDCNFCSKSMPGYRFKSLDFIFKEIDCLINQYNIEAMHFIDELLIAKEKRFFEFCNRIAKYKIKWDCQGRINLVNEKMLLKMKNSNGICIGFGIESGSQKILDAMNKKIKVNDIERVITYCNKINLPIKIQLIYGYPGENCQTLKETAKLFKKLRLPGRRFNIITPMPGSNLYEKAKEDGFIGDSDSARITEADYHEFLSINRGKVNEDIFYNRTEFEDKIFFKQLKRIENKIFNQFIIILFTHPIYIIKKWNLYKTYIIERWKNTWGRISILKKIRFITILITKPKEAVLIIKNKLNNIIKKMS